MPKITLIKQKADYLTTLRLLKERGMEPLTYQEVFVELAKNAELKDKLKGKWFWLAGKGIKKEGIFAIDEKGEIYPENGERDIEKMVRVWSGDQPLSLSVSSVDVAAQFGRRFYLNANNRPDRVAPVVVGKLAGEPKA